MCSRALWTFRTPPSQTDTSRNASSDVLAGLTIVATLAHELCWTCDYREDPRCCAADCRCQCPFNRWLSCAYRFDECLRAATSNTGSCIAKCWFCRACPKGHVTTTIKRSWRCLVSLVVYASSIKATSWSLLVSDVANFDGCRCFGTPCLQIVHLETTTVGLAKASCGS